MAYPDLVIAGTMRGGTSSLWAAVTRHPRISPGGFLEGARWIAFKEHSYFSRLHRYFSYEQYCAWYYEEQHRKLHLDCSPDYLHTPSTAARLAAHSPGARIVILLREPAARCWSHYWHERNVNRCETLPFNRAVSRVPSRLDFEDYWYHFCYLEAGHYAQHLAQWCDNFPAEQLFIKRSEDLFADFAATVGEIYLFFGLTGTPIGEIHVNAGTAPSMPPTLRDRLEAYYEPHNRHLYEQYGVDWKEKEDEGQKRELRRSIA